MIANHRWINFAAPQMIFRRGSAISIVSSIGRLRGSSVIGADKIRKAADFELARSLAVGHGPHEVRANCIAPGFIMTDFARALWDKPETLARATSTTPFRPTGEPDEIAGAVVVFASQAGSFMTGQALSSTAARPSEPGAENIMSEFVQAVQAAHGARAAPPGLQLAAPVLGLRGALFPKQTPLSHSRAALPTRPPNVGGGTR